MGAAGHRPFVTATMFLFLSLLLASCGGGERTAVDLSDRVADSALRETAPPADNSVLRFGFEPRNNVLEDARQYASFLAWLTKATGRPFELRFLPRNGNIVDEIGSGRIHFAAVGAGTFLRMQAKYGVTPLVRGLNAKGKAEYRSAIVVPMGSPVRRLEDLRGRSFAFGGVNSTQGHLIPRILLAEHGITLGDLSRFEYTGSHRNAAAAVAGGRFDAGGIQDLLAQRLEGEGMLRILVASRDYPSSGIVAAREVPEADRERVRAALLDFRPLGKDAPGLYHWDRTEMAGGFVAASESDYIGIGKWARAFGLLVPEPAGTTR
jgi:phosphonate transport system substrate-binding protein